MTIRFLAAALVGLASLTVAAQPPAPGGQPPSVTFKVDINYVEIDAVVTDAQGALVRDLKAADFELLEQGRPQTLASVSLVDIPVERPDPPLSRSSVVEPDVASNRDVSDGRVFVLVLDDLHTSFQRSRHVRAAAEQFVRRYTGTNDTVAVVTTGGDSRKAQEFTSSQARLLAAIGRFSGQKLQAGASDMERVARARDTYSALAALSDYLGAVRGRRKAVLWFGEGVEFNIDDQLQANGADIVRQAMLDAVAAATRGNVNIYGIDARGVGAGLDDAIGLEGLPDDTSGGMPGVMEEVRRAHNSLRVVSNETGGFPVVNRGNINEAFDRVIGENSSYYVLGYYSSDNRRDGRFRPVEVRVTRPGLRVRARKGYTAPKGRAVPPPSTAAEASPAVREALRSAIPTRGLTISAFAAPFAGTGRKTSLAIVVEIDPGQLTFVEQGGVYVEHVELVTLALDASGRRQDGGRDEAPLRLSPRSYDVVMKGGLRLTRRLDVPPGRYQVRVAARASNREAVGAVSLDLDVPDFAKAPLQVSGIVLASAAASEMVTANPDPAFTDVLPTSPTARRVFPAGDVLTLFAEVYDTIRSPHRVAIRTSVTSDTGAVVFASDDERKSEEVGSKGGGFGHRVTLPLKGIPPGRYVLTLEAKALVGDGAAVSREVEFRIR